MQRINLNTNVKFSSESFVPGNKLKLSSSNDFVVLEIEIVNFSQVLCFAVNFSCVRSGTKVAVFEVVSTAI